MKTVVITGARGFLGTWLVKKLLKFKKYNLYLLLEDLCNPSLTMPHADVVIHLAAKHPSYSGDLFQANLEATKTLARLCSVNTHFVFLSTDHVFGGGEQKKYVETDVKKSINDYGKSKSLAEDYLFENIEKLTVLRTSLLYGYTHPTRKNFINFLTKKLSDGKKVEVFSDIYCRPTHVEDLSNFIVEVIEKNIYGVYHACSDDYVNRVELANIFCESNELDKNLIDPVVSPPNGFWVPHLNLNPSKIFLETAKVLLEDGLKYIKGKGND